MRNLVKYVGIGLLVMGLAACDDKDTNATAQGSVAESNATGNPNKAIELKGHKMQQLDSIISAKGQTAYSSVILGNVGNQLLTMQITLPADNQQKSQTTAENIINTLVIQ